MDIDEEWSCASEMARRFKAASMSNLKAVDDAWP
jgi:hypothetical protein